MNVHQECYGIGRVPPGLWFCQPCAELQRQSQSLRSPGLGVQANILWAQCALCCRGAGALKRSTDGRWVHVFCAQVNYLQINTFCLLKQLPRVICILRISFHIEPLEGQILHEISAKLICMYCLYSGCLKLQLGRIIHLLFRAW